MLSTKRIIIGIVIVVVLLAAGFAVFYMLNMGDEGGVGITDMKNSDFNVVPTKSDRAGVELDSGLSITSKKEITLDGIKDIFNIEPAVPYNLTKLSNNEYSVAFVEPLAANTVYRVDLEDKDNNRLSWAFQTVKDFRLVSTLPRDKGLGVPLETGIEFNFSYSDFNAIDDLFVIEPSIKGKFIYNKNQAIFMPDEKLKTDTVYTVTLKAGVALKDTDKLINEDYTFQFMTVANNIDKEYLNFSDTLFNFASNVTPYLGVHVSEGLRNQELTVDIYRYQDANQFIAGIKELSDADLNWMNATNKTIPIGDTLDKVVSFKSKLQVLQNRMMHYLPLPDQLAEGYYLVNVSNGDKNYQTHLQVNNSVVYIMLGEKETLAWVNDALTGQPVSGATLVSEKGQRATTNNDGIAVIKDKVVDRDKFIQQYFKIELNNRATYVAKLQASYYGYDFYYGYQPDNTDYWSYLYIDRDLFRQSDTVNLWGLVKARTDGTKLNELTVTLSKSSYLGDRVEIAKKTIKLDEYGTFDELFTYNDLIPGSYYLELKNDDVTITGKYFEVRNYKKPAYQLTAEFDTKKIFGWESAELMLNANFYEGSPVTGLKLSASYYENNSNKKMPAIVTDKNGAAEVKYTPKITTTDWSPIGVNINIVNDQAEDQNIWQYADILVFPKDIMVNVDVKEKNNEATVVVSTNLIDITKQDDDEYANYVDRYKGAPIDRPLSIKINEVNYVKKVTGSYYDFINKVVVETFEYNTVKTLVSSESAVTLDGVYEFNYDFEDFKDYEIIVETTDTRGNNIVYSTYENRFRYESYNYDDIYYTLEETTKDKYNYRVNEEINLQLNKNGVAVDEINGDRMLMLKLKNGLQEYTISDKTNNKFRFKNEDIPNFYYEAIYFDGSQIYLAGMKGIYYDYTEKELNITVTPDKDYYKPGETVNLAFTVKDKSGRPVSAKLNISIVDEAMFALRDQDVNTAQSIYNYLNGTGELKNYVTSATDEMFGGAERGSGGDYADYVRSDFKDTAIFNSISTNNNGNGSVSFVLPDNLTSWRVTYQAISKDLHAGNGKIAVNSQLPFFALVIANERYLEGDLIVVSARSYGTETKEQGLVDYLVTLTDSVGKETKLTAQGKANDYTNIALGKLAQGTYTLQVEGKQGSLSDGLKQELIVEKSLLKSNIINYYDLKDGLQLLNTEGYTHLRFYSKNNALFYDALTGLAYAPGMRVDQLLARKIGAEILNERFVEDIKNSEEFKLDQYQLGDGGISLLPYSDSEVLLSAKVASAGVEHFDESAFKAYFNRILEDKNSTEVDIAAAYWGLAVCSEPVLLDIQNIVSNNILSIKEQVLYAVALAEFGDYKLANQLFIKLLKENGKKIGEQIYVDTGIDRDDTLEATALLSIVAAKLNDDTRYRMLDYLIHNQTEKVLTYLEQIIFIQNDFPKATLESSFTYSIGDTSKTVKLNGTEQFALLVSQEELKKLKFSDVKGELVLATNYYGNLADAHYILADSFSLNRTYQVQGKNNTDIGLSDIVKVTLTPSFKANAPDGYYEITDCLPAGLRYIENTDMRPYGLSTPIYHDNERVVFGYYYNKKSKNEPITYYARVAGIGEYIGDSAVMNHYNSGSLVFTKQERLIIK